MSLPLPTYAADETLVVRSELLGDLTVERGELLHLSAGLFGFPECHNFVLVETDRAGAFWLQSADYPALAFLVIDPFPYFPGYRVDLPPAELKRLDVREADEAAVLAIVTMPGEPDAPFTANLQGPIVMNARTRTAAQCVLAGDDHPVRAAFSIPDGAAGAGERP
jgi:flagellar assembly factor FliW